ncbi:MAG: 50S ribosomal protein L23 [Endomicrobium sp.]|jgi:large subunit ribosomal protein L23|nr:50S ribosomal protein L23 [Endomicrobium sp.]
MSRSIIKKPIITNKTMKLQESSGKYTFMVDKRANKNQIKHALEQLFEVKIINIRTLNYTGKRKRTNMSSKFGYKSDWKKAIIKLKKQQKIYMINDKSTNK